MLIRTNVLRESESHLDLYSGSGVVGHEMLSRGIGRAAFVDFAPECVEAIEENLDMVGYTDRAQVICASVEAVLTSPEQFGLTQPFNLITITPPYEEVVYADLMEQVAS